jgi:hypothetical protein
MKNTKVAKFMIGSLVLGIATGISAVFWKKVDTQVAHDKESQPVVTEIPVNKNSVPLERSQGVDDQGSRDNVVDKLIEGDVIGDKAQFKGTREVVHGSFCFSYSKPDGVEAPCDQVEISKDRGSSFGMTIKFIGKNDQQVFYKVSEVQYAPFGKIFVVKGAGLRGNGGLDLSLDAESNNYCASNYKEYKIICNVVQVDGFKMSSILKK